MPTLEAEQLCALPREGKVAKQLRQVKQKNKKKLLKFLSFQKMQMFAQDWPGSMALSSSSVKGPVTTCVKKIVTRHMSHMSAQCPREEQELEALSALPLHQPGPSCDSAACLLLKRASVL